jgi:4-amino-4-deoxy-L-arabinose transferase-like glycosyltransferase
VAVVDFRPESAEVPDPRPYGRRLASALVNAERHPWVCRAFLGLWCGALFFHGLTAGQLWKTESLRAIVAAEYLRSGNWIVPTLYGEPLFTKPPGMYAAIALCSWPFGEVTEWTARLPSALAATLTVLMLYGYFTRLFGRRGGLVIAVLAPMSPLWLDKATAAEIDMMQVMWVTGSILALLRALETPERSGRWWLAALVCVAGGVLTKWTAPAFFYATAIPLLWWRGQLRLLWDWRHLAAAGVGAALCLAWIGAAVAMTGWDVFAETVKREALQRMVPEYAYTIDPWYVALLHPLRLWYTNLPWSLVALIACRPAFGRLWSGRERMLWQALHCWLWPNVLIWSLMLDHKARHSFPLFPAFAGLAALVWVAWLDGRLAWKWRVQPRKVLIAALAGWLIVKLVFVNVVIPNQRGMRDPRGTAAVLAVLVPAESVLYLFQLKDEGIMFYYGRTVRRLPSPAELPSHGEPLYGILAKGEWERWRHHPPRPTVPLRTDLIDDQGEPMVLVRID